MLRPWRLSESTGSPCGRQMSECVTAMETLLCSCSPLIWDQASAFVSSMAYLCVLLISRPHGSLVMRSVRPSSIRMRPYSEAFTTKATALRCLGVPAASMVPKTASMGRPHGNHGRFAVYVAPSYDKITKLIWTFVLLSTRVCFFSISNMNYNFLFKFESSIFN